MNFIPVDPYIESNKKIRRLMRRVGMTAFETWPRVVKLWMYAFLNAQDGDVTELRTDPFILADILEIEDHEKASVFYESMILVGLLDENDGSVDIHGWFDDGAGKLFLIRKSDRDRKRRQVKVSGGTPAELRRNSGGKIGETDNFQRKNDDLPGCPADEKPHDRRGQNRTEEDKTEEEKLPSFTPLQDEPASADAAEILVFLNSCTYLSKAINRSGEKIPNYWNTEKARKWLVSVMGAYGDRISILTEVQKAETWCIAKPKQAPRSNPLTFLSSWLSRADEYSRKQGNYANKVTFAKPNAMAIPKGSGARPEDFGFSTLESLAAEEAAEAAAKEAAQKQGEQTAGATDEIGW